jgi:hypothetical protein
MLIFITKRAASVCLIVAALVAPIPVGSSETIIVTHDGVWWQSMDRAQRTIAIEGLLVGFDAGYGLASFYATTALQSNLHQTGRFSPPLQSFKRRVDKVKPTLSDRTFKTMVDEIDKVYDTHPKLLKLNVSLFVQCAVMSGSKCDEPARIEERFAK